LLTFFIRLFVPESERWRHEQRRGSTSNWAARDLAGVGVGAVAACLMIYLWAVDLSLWVRLPGSLVALVVVTLGYTYPVWRYLERSGTAVAADGGGPAVDRGAMLRRMVLGAWLGGGAVLVTWAAVHWGAVWAGR